MKNISLLLTVVLAIIVMICAGIHGMINDYSYGPFFTFVGVITGIGLGIDLTNIVKVRIRRSNIRKLGGW